MPDFSDQYVKSNEWRFEQLKLTYQIRQNKSFPTGLYIDELSIRTLLCDDLIAKIIARVLVEKLEPYVIRRNKMISIPVPRTWWDHFKLAYMDRWWMPFKKVHNRIITREVAFTTVIRPMNAFPDSTVVYPKQLGKPVRIYELDEFPMMEREINDNL